MGVLAVRHDPTSAALVRHSIADDLADASVTPDSIADVVLVASELVGNAVLHTAASADDLGISWEIGADTVTVRVVDPSDTPPRLRTADVSVGGGRGLAIVAALAEDWGTRPLAIGKEIWARVAVSRA